jgi:hypothetical protein
VPQEQKLLDELAVAYMEKHGTVAVRDNHDGTIDFISEDGHVYVLAARRKHPEQEAPGEMRMRAAEELAAEFGTDVGEWLV